MNQKDFDQLLNGLAQMRDHLHGKPVHGLRVTEVTYARGTSLRKDITAQSQSRSAAHTRNRATTKHSA
jgi:hypothetical protein